MAGSFFFISWVWYYVKVHLKCKVFCKILYNWRTPSRASNFYKKIEINLDHLSKNNLLIWQLFQVIFKSEFMVTKRNAFFLKRTWKTSAYFENFWSIFSFYVVAKLDNVMYCKFFSSNTISLPKNLVWLSLLFSKLQKWYLPKIFHQKRDSNIISYNKQNQKPGLWKCFW